MWGDSTEPPRTSPSGWRGLRRKLTRRAFLPGLAALTLPGADKPLGSFPSEWVGFPDPATEFPVVRLTNPAFTSFLAGRSSFVLARNGKFLIYSSDRSGSFQAFRMDLAAGESEQLTEAGAFLPGSLCLMPDERSLCFFDGPWLYQLTFSNRRLRRVHSRPDGWDFGMGMSVAPDGRRVAFVEKRGPVQRLRLVTIGSGSAATVVAAQEPLLEPTFRPAGSWLLYRRGERSLCLTGFDGRQDRRLALAPGRVGNAHWSPDGTSVLYLNLPDDRRTLNSIRQFQPDSGADSLIAPTSQLACFSPNRDASMFVGASSNRASPHVLLVDRNTKRELTLAEHRASDPAAVMPMFSATSQQVYFLSDRQGKTAIYGMRVDRLVEKTDT